MYIGCLVLENLTKNVFSALVCNSGSFTPGTLGPMQCFAAFVFKAYFQLSTRTFVFWNLDSCYSGIILFFKNIYLFKPIALFYN